MIILGKYMTERVFIFMENYMKQLHDFIYSSISEGVPPLFFWIIFSGVMLVLLFFIYKVAKKVYKRHYIRLVFYSIGLIMTLVATTFAVYMIITAHNVEHNDDVVKHTGIVKEAKPNDEGGYDLQLKSGRNISVKNIVDENDKSLKSVQSPIQDDDKVTYYQSAKPKTVLKAVIDQDQHESSNTSKTQL